MSLSGRIALLFAVCIHISVCYELTCDELKLPVQLIGSQSFLKLSDNRTVLFPWNGIGYSPVPNSDDLAATPYGDYFQSTYSSMWQDRDINLMVDMNVSIVRVWSWNFILEHTQFLDALWQSSGCRPLRLLLPFLMTIVDYPDLSYPDVRLQVLTDYEAFLNRYNSHPAIVAYMIGNELNRAYNEQLDFLFSILKDMIAMRDSKGITIPITLPLAGDASFEILVDTYYDTVNLDFWSVQVYDPVRLQEVISYYRNRTALNPKPLLISEFGVDAFGSLQYTSINSTPVVNELAQAAGLDTMWQIIKANSDIVMGASVMEFMDEWWKGNFPLTSDKNESCPNLRYDFHNYCGNIVGNNSLLHEEWLGVFSQQPYTYFLSSYTYCILPRQAYYTLRGWWSNNTDVLPQGALCAEVGLTGAPYYLVATALYVILLGVLAEACFFGSDKRKKTGSVAAVVEAMGKRKSMEVVAAMSDDDFRPKRISRLLSELVKGKLYSYTSDLDAFELVHMRVKALIWDKISSAKEFVYRQVTEDLDEEGEEEQEDPKRDNEGVPEDISLQVQNIDDLHDLEKRIFIRSVNEVYFKYMEAYRMWKKQVLGKDLKPESTVEVAKRSRKRLDDIILWNVVHQTSGTISHAPEKICQVFYFVKKYLQGKGKEKPSASAHDIEMKSSKDKDDVDVQGAAIIQSLMKIFKRYYDDVYSKHVNYDDLNSDGLSKVIKKVNWQEACNMESLEAAYFRYMHEAKWKEEQEESEKQKNDEERGKAPINDNSDDPNEERDKLDKQTKIQRKHTLLTSGEVPVFKIVHEANSIRIISTPSAIGLDTSSDVPITPIKKIEEKHTTVKKYFPNLGGVLGCIVCFSWLLRLNVWIIVGAQYCGVANETDFFDSAGRCRLYGIPILALADASLAFAANIFRFFVAGSSNFTGLNYVKLVYHTLWFLFMVAYQVVPLLTNFEILVLAYLGLAVLFALIEEFYLNITQSAFPIPGHEDKNRTKAFVNVGFWAGNLILGVVFGLWKFQMIPNFLGQDVVFFTSIFGINIPLFLVVCACIAPFLGYGVAVGLGMLRANIAAGSDIPKKMWLRKTVYSDARYNFRLLLFWCSTFAIQWIFLAHVLIPSVQELTPAMCGCEAERLQTTAALATKCTWERRVMCWGALVMMWTSTILISYVSIFSSFNVVLLIAGTYSAVQSRVGNVKSWSEVERYFAKIVSKNMVALSGVFKKRFFQNNFWNDFIDSMYSEHLLSRLERDLLKYSKNGKKKPVFRPAPYSKEAQRRIIKFLWSLEAMLNTKGTAIPEFRQRYMVRTMPSWTVMVPCHSETCVYLQEDLVKPQKGAPRISTIEYLVATFPDEWHNLAQELRPDPNGAPANELMDDFLNTPILKPDEELDREKGQCSAMEVDHICFWASYRGQTLVRTVKGLFNYRIALEKLAMAEEGVWFVKSSVERLRKIKDIQKMVKKKFQIILAYQIYQPNISGLWTKERNASFNKLLTRFHDLDVVYNHTDDRRSIMLRFKKNGELVQYQIARPGPLLIGEPKAENQHHALAFALGSVIQVNDMNMYASLENGYKVPFLLNQFFNTPEQWEDPAMLAPTFRIVGYPEHTYTKKLSTVGDLMGSAEYCFVTIMQRVLAFLRVRAHYGHPDYVDGYWVRTRGGVSKASHLINTNEDIFAGYEMIGRGERIKYIEYIEQEKGRESSFDNAFIFEAKLAKGAAQQIKSPHVYLLNERLPLLVRLSLFFGSIGFYISTMLMSMTIDFYIFTILLYISSGVDYHALGLLDAVIAVPWLLQIGYIQALPLLLELSIEQGIWEGLALFLKRLLIGIIFFVFHVRTKSYYFAQGLLGGKGGYMGTGRGFGLDRRGFIDLYKLYFDSHFNNALILFVACMAYCVASSDSASEIALRLASILLVVFSWLVAPVLFNPYPTYESQQNDFDQMLEWIRSPVELKLDAKIIVEIAKESSEVNRKKVITRWWSQKEPGSFIAYVIKNMIEEWQAEDHLFKGYVDRLMMFIQKFVYFSWRYGPWILLCLPLYHYESLFYLFFVFECVGLTFYISKRHGERHEYFSAIQLAMLFIIAPLVTTLVYSRMTFAQLIVSMLFYVVIAYAFLGDFLLGFINNVLVKRLRVIEGAELFPKRLKIPQTFYSLQGFWPTVVLMFLAVINSICVLLSNILTTLLYNGAVTDKWNRSYMYTKMQFTDKSVILQAAKDAAAQQGLSVASESESGRERSNSDTDFFTVDDKIQAEMAGVKADVTGKVDMLDQKIAEFRDLMTKDMDTLRKHVMSRAREGLKTSEITADLSYYELKRLIEEKTQKVLDVTTDKEREAINIDLEKLYVLLESTPEYQEEEAAMVDEKRRVNEVVDKKALEDMRAKYSEASMANNAEIKARFTAFPALAMILLDKSEIVRKPANVWSFITINGLSLEELRAIHANLPHFGRHQMRQLAWVKALEARIDQGANSAGGLSPKPGPVRLGSSFKAHPSAMKSPRGAPSKLELLAEIENKHEKKNVSFIK